FAGPRGLRRRRRPARSAETALASQGCQSSGPIKEAEPAKPSSREALMRRDNPADLPRLARLRRLASRLWAGLPLLALASPSPPVALAQAVNPQPPPSPCRSGVGGEGVLIVSPAPLAPLP